MNERRARVWFALFVLAVFCTGAGVGVVLGVLVPRPLLPGFLGGGPPPGPPGRLGDRLQKDLDLTSGQRQQLEGILQARRAGLEELQRDVRARFDAEQEALRKDIAQILTPEQRKLFDSWLSRWPAPEDRGPEGRPAGPGGLGHPGGPPRPF